MPVVAATAAFSGLRPVAKAFGWSSRMRKTLGIGSPARSRQPPDHLVELRRARPRHRLGVVHPEHHLVRVPVGEGVGAEREEEGDHHAAGAADEIAHAHEQRGHRREQEHRPEEVHAHPAPLRHPDARSYDRPAEPGEEYMSDEPSEKEARRAAAAARALAEAEARRAAAPAPRPAARDRRPRRPRAGALRRLGAPGDRGRLLRPGPPRGGDDQAGDLHQLGREVRRALRQPALRHGGAQPDAAVQLHLLHRQTPRASTRQSAPEPLPPLDVAMPTGTKGIWPKARLWSATLGRARGPRPLHGPRPRGRRPARRLLQLRRPRRGDPGAEPEHPDGAARPDLALPLPGRQAPAAAAEVPRRPAGRGRRLPVRAALRHPRGAGRRALLARALGAALPHALRPHPARSTSSCRRGCPATPAW